MLKRINLSYLKNKRINVFFLFLLLAFGILVLTKLSKTHSAPLVFKVELTNVPKELVVLNSEQKTLTLTITTSGFKWLHYYFYTPTLHVDFNTDVVKEQTQYIWKLNKGLFAIKQQIGPAVTLEKVVPEVLRFDVDHYAIKVIPIHADVALSYSSGYNSMKGVELIPDSIKVIGPEHALQTIEALNTQPIQLQQLKQSVNKRVKIDMSQLNAEVTLESRWVQLKIDVEKFTEGKVSVPVEVIKEVEKIMSTNYDSLVEEKKELEDLDFYLN